MTTMNSLPDDILQRIFLCISPFSDLLRISATCQRWRCLIVHDVWFLRHYFPFLNQSLTSSDSQLLGWLNCDLKNFSKSVSYHSYENRTLESFYRKERRLPMRSLYLDPELFVFEFERYGVRTLAFWIKVDRPIGVPLSELSLIRWRMANDLCLCLNGARLAHMNFACTPMGIDQKVRFYISQHEWHHIALVIATNRTKLSLYIDGRRCFRMNSGRLSQDEDLIALSNGSHNKWIGRIADAAMWSRALHPYEVKAIYTQRDRLDRIDVLDFLQSNFRPMPVQARSWHFFDRLRRLLQHS